jgi:membrane protease YdiL (CAAX protease family)
VTAHSTIRRFYNRAVAQRLAWLMLVCMVGLFAVASYRQWLPAALIGPIEPLASPAGVISKELLQALVVLAATFLLGFIRNQSVTMYGFPIRQAFGKDFWRGSLWGFLMLSATMSLMAVAHSYTPHSLALSVLEILKYGTLWAAAFLLVGIAEEVAFRGYLQYALTTRLGFWPAAGVTSLFFAFAHRNNGGETWFGLANIVLIGMFACVALRRTGNLWFSIGWHMAFDWGESFVYSVPNSGAPLAGHLFSASVIGNKWLTGGTVGPEASVFNVLITMMGIALLTRIYPVARYPNRAV